MVILVVALCLIFAIFTVLIVLLHLMNKANMRTFFLMLEVPTEYLRYLLNRSEEFINRNKGRFVSNVKSLADSMDEASSMSSTTSIEIFNRRKFGVGGRLRDTEE